MTFIRNTLFAFLWVFAFAACNHKQKTERAESLNEKASIQYQFAYDSYVQGDLIPALGSALQAVELGPRNPDARNLLGLIYFRQQKYKEAEEAFKKGIALDPSLSEIHNNLGTLYFEQKRYKDAALSLEKALENPLYLHPERIYNNLGLVYQALGKKDEARSAFERSISLKATFYLPFQNLGKFYFEGGDFKRAQNLLEEAVRLCADCSEPRYRLGAVLMKTHKENEAFRLFKQGAELDPQGYFGQLCKQSLETKALKEE